MLCGLHDPILFMLQVTNVQRDEAALYRAVEQALALLKALGGTSVQRYRGPNKVNHLHTPRLSGQACAHLTICQLHPCARASGTLPVWTAQVQSAPTQAHECLNEQRVCVQVQSRVSGEVIVEFDAAAICQEAILVVGHIRHLGPSDVSEFVARMDLLE